MGWFVPPLKLAEGGGAAFDKLSGCGFDFHYCCRPGGDLLDSPHPQAETPKLGVSTGRGDTYALPNTAASRAMRMYMPFFTWRK